MTEAEEILNRAKASAEPKSKKQSKNQHQDFNLDLTAKYNIGVEIANAEIKAIHDGYTDQMSKGLGFLGSLFSGNNIGIASAQYTRALPPQDEQDESFIALLFGSSQNQLQQADD